MNTSPTPLLPAPREFLMLDDQIRGVPPGITALDSRLVGNARWRPVDGSMSLPVLTLDETAFLANRDLMMAYVRSHGIDIAPHAKTPMSPDLARNLIEAGAWATTVADIRQATVMVRAGLTRLILANETGGAGGAGRLAAFMKSYPQTELYVFADSVAFITALAEAWRAVPGLAPLPILVEAGSGRAGTRSLAEAEAVAAAVMESAGVLRLAGVGAYEGNSIQADQPATDEVMGELIDRTGALFRRIRPTAGDDAELILTAGGSLYFDRVVSALAPIIREDGKARLVLRGGAIFFSDHGICGRFLAYLDERGGFMIDDRKLSAAHAFRPALRLWAEVLSRPEPGLAICGLGMRDASFDQGFPVMLGLHRQGRLLPSPAQPPVVTKLNDQHCFLTISAETDLAVGDVAEFGVTHACTTIDRHRLIYGIGRDGYVAHVFPTHF
jgi:D-serine deaminase-like pyridoxal phosphate-dependent protein